MSDNYTMSTIECKSYELLLCKDEKLTVLNTNEELAHNYMPYWQSTNCQIKLLDRHRCIYVLN